MGLYWKVQDLVNIFIGEILRYWRINIDYVYLQVKSFLFIASGIVTD